MLLKMGMILALFSGEREFIFYSSYTFIKHWATIPSIIA